MEEKLVAVEAECADNKCGALLGAALRSGGAGGACGAMDMGSARTVELAAALPYAEEVGGSRGLSGDTRGLVEAGEAVLIHNIYMCTLQQPTPPSCSILPPPPPQASLRE